MKSETTITDDVIHRWHTSTIHHATLINISLHRARLNPISQTAHRLRRNRKWRGSPWRRYRMHDGRAFVVGAGLRVSISISDCMPITTKAACVCGVSLTISVVRQLA